MPDDPLRPLPDQQSDPRPLAGAPEWWGALGRPDLPLDGQPAPPLRAAPASRHAPARSPRSRLATLHWRAWAFNATILVLAVLIVCVGLGVVSFSMFLTIALLFGVPLALAGATATLVARRSR